MKKTIVIVIVIVIIIIIGLIFYFGLRETKVAGIDQPAEPPPEAPIIPSATNLIEPTTTESAAYNTAVAENSTAPPAQLKNLLDVTARFYKKDQIIILEKSSGLLETTAWIYHQKNKTLTPLFEGVIGLSLNWSADGEQILKFQIDPKTRQPNLTLINQTTGLALELPWVTFPEKCLIEEEVLYCAVPRELPANFNWPDDYLKRRFYPQDKIIKLTLKTSDIEIVEDGIIQIIDATDLKVIKQELYFTNRRDGKVYKLNI